MQRWNGFTLYPLILEQLSGHGLAHLVHPSGIVSSLVLARKSRSGKLLAKYLIIARTTISQDGPSATLQLPDGPDGT